jgi:hypothetical protein
VTQGPAVLQFFNQTKIPKKIKFYIKVKIKGKDKENKSIYINS